MTEDSIKDQSFVYEQRVMCKNYNQKRKKLTKNT